jgi:hypothetical protein
VWCKLRQRKKFYEICTPLGYYIASNGNPLPMFWDNVSLPSSRVKKSERNRKPAGKHMVYIGKGVGRDC